jgi:quercetin dioxygenase-like cupin family protein
MRLDSGIFLRVDESPNRRLEEGDKRRKQRSYRTLTSPEADKHLMALSITIPPRTAHEGVGYQDEGEEFVYVISGQVELTVDRGKRVLAERESFRLNSNLDHHLPNPGDTDAELLVILHTP